MEFWPIVVSLVAAYAMIIGCYVFVFQVWCSLRDKLETQLVAMEVRLGNKLGEAEKVLDQIITDLAYLKGERAAERKRDEDDSDVRRL